MNVLRPTPVLLAALCFAAGDALGLLRPGLAALPVGFLAGLAALSARRRGASTGFSGPSTALLCLVACAAAGALAGARAGTALRSACEGSLETGAAVTAAGRAVEDHRPAGRDRTRITLADVRLAGASGPCRLPRLIVFLAREPGTLAAGSPLRVRGSWMRFEAAPGRWPVPRGRAGMLVEARRLEEGSASAVGPGGPAVHLRRAFGRALERRVGPDVRPTARALLLAEKDELAGSVRRRFADAGLAHLLAISGLHVGILGGLLLGLLAPLVRAPARHRIAAAVVAGYVFVIGAPVAAVRAALLFGGWTWARSRGRPLRLADLLGAAALAALLPRPETLLDPGFQLSFAGFAGVVTGAGAGVRLTGRRPARRGAGRRARLGRRLRTPAAALAASAGAFAATAPISAAHFGRVAPVALASHFVGTPLVALSLAGLVLAPVPGPAGRLGGDAATWSLRVLHASAAWFADLDGAHRPAGPPSPVHWSAWALAALATLHLAAGRRAARAAVPLAGALALLVAGPVLPLLRRSGTAVLCTLAVGQGDAAVLRTSGGRWVVLDGGPRPDAGPGRDGIVPALRRLGARRVDLVVLSHPDMDHLGGLEEMFRSFPVGGLLDSGDPLPREAYARLLALVEERAVPFVRARSGTRLRLDGTDLLVLAPPVPREERREGRVGRSTARATANQTSVVVRLDVNGFRYLNPGDATAAEEEAILRSWPADSLRADLLKAGHHGSRTSTSAAWLAAVRPAMVVISAGAGNRYGHPHAQVLRRLSRAGVPEVHRTDRTGTLCVDIDGTGRWRPAGATGWRESAARSGPHAVERGSPGAH
ncbi:MAG: ComEC/Rec2 family competence protein [Gemmatimonadota bacterium]|nr:ComEC/Rec2 family competence protein [Gemmatimonadota bacterium]